MAIVRRLLTLIAAGSGILLSARALLGPYRLFVPVNNPLNLQCIFGLTATLALACATSGREGKSEIPKAPPIEFGFPRRFIGVACGFPILLILLIGFAAFWRNLSDYFLSDDFYLITLATTWKKGYLPELFLHGGGTEFFRPLGGLALVATSLIAGFNPFLWHLASLLIHLANSVLVFVLATTLSFGRRAAFIGSVLFTIHGTRPEAVTWIAGRFDPLSTLFVLIGLLSFALSCLTRRKAYYWAALLSMSLGMLCKESAFVFPMLAGLSVLVLPGSSRRDLIRTAPFYAVAGVIFAIRWFALGGLGGYVSKASIEPGVFSVVLQPGKALGMRLWSAFYFPLNWSAEPGLYLGILLAAFVAVMVLMIATVSLKPRPVLFCVAFAVISSLPAVSQLLLGSDLEKSRLLYLPSIGFCLLLGYALSVWQPRSVSLPGTLAVLLFHVACLQHNLAIWRTVASLTGSTCGQIVEELTTSTNRVIIRGMPGSLRGVYFLRNGVKSCLDLKAGRTLNLEVDETGRGRVENQTVVFDWDAAGNRLLRVD